MLNWISNIFNKLKHRTKPFLSYGILQPCFRCVYGKRYEPILIVSLHRGPRVLVNLDTHTYIRKGKCIGIDKCNLCFQGNIKETPCKWSRMK